MNPPRLTPPELAKLHDVTRDLRVMAANHAHGVMETDLRDAADAVENAYLVGTGDDKPTSKWSTPLVAAIVVLSFIVGAIAIVDWTIRGIMWVT